VSPNSFWDFSLAIYAKDGVAPACLRLQDKHGFDVNLLLFACWSARYCELTLNKPAWRTLLAETRDWRDTIITPLRDVRRRLKVQKIGGYPKNETGLRAAVQQIELDCERIEQDFLATRIVGLRLDGTLSAGAGFDSQKAVMGSLEALANQLGVRPNAQHLADFSLLAVAAGRLDRDFRSI
jgi:uncharacterized protein (TIGR02444 family)